MAIHFITGGTPVDGYMLHRADPRDIRVGIVHEPKEGYLLSYDRDVIKEEMSLSEFMRRIHSADPQMRKYGNERLEQDIRQVLIALSPGSRKITDIAHWLNTRYMTLIRDNHIVLVEHNISYKSGNAAVKTLESVRSRERSMLQSELWDQKRFEEEMDKQGYKIQDQPTTPDQAYRVSDDEVYYLLVP